MLTIYNIFSYKTMLMKVQTHQAILISRWDDVGRLEDEFEEEGVADNIRMVMGLCKSIETPKY